MTTTETLKTFGLPLGALTLGASTYLLFALVAGDPYPQNERRLLVCNEHLSDAMRVELEAGGALLRPGQRYAHVARVVACASKESGACDDATDAVVLLREASERTVVGDGRCTLEACDERCDNPGSISIATPPCVTPACWNAAGEWDESMVVDCKRRVTRLGGDVDTVWQGCATFSAADAEGSACVPTSCDVFGGDGAESL